MSEEKRNCEFLLGALDLRHVARIEHILENLEMVNPYTQVHEVLLSANEASSETKPDELLCVTELGDLRPTELLVRMRKLMLQNSPQPW